MFYHAVHLLNHGSALESGTLGLHGAQFCALAGERDAGVVCTCASRVLSCPEPAIVGTTKGLKVDLPELGNKSSVKSWLAKHPNNAFLVRVRGVRVRGSARRACGARAVQRACDCATAKGVGPGCGRCEHGLRCGGNASVHSAICGATARGHVRVRDKQWQLGPAPLYAARPHLEIACAGRWRRRFASAATGLALLLVRCIRF